jgi:hypothetical protein
VAAVPIASQTRIKKKAEEASTDIVPLSSDKFAEINIGINSIEWWIRHE